jgi:hypothetical protein
MDFPPVSGSLFGTFVHGFLTGERLSVRDFRYRDFLPESGFLFRLFA